MEPDNVILYRVDQGHPTFKVGRGEPVGLQEHLIAYCEMPQGHVEVCMLCPPLAADVAQYELASPIVSLN